MRSDEFVTSDLSLFGARELAIAGELLTAYAQTKEWAKDFALGDGVHVEFNLKSGYVFLVDKDGNTALMNDDDKLENWDACSYCCVEGFRSELKPDYRGYCSECVAKGKN